MYEEENIMDEVRLYEMYLTEAIKERKTDLLNRSD